MLDELVQEIEAAGGIACALAGDVSAESFARALVDEATSRYGGLDIAVNNAGVLGPMAPTPDVTREAWDETMATNLTSAFLASEPDEQARAALFLASDAASFITGSAMLVDGGVSINKT